MSEGWFHRNQRLLMVLLLLVLAPTFAFTGLMTSVMSAGGGNYYEVFGKIISAKEWRRLDVEYRRVKRAQLSRPGRVPATPQEVLNYYIFREEADRLGLVVSDEELEEAIREQGKNLIIQHKLYRLQEQRSFASNLQEEFRRLQSTVVFNHKDYRDALRNLPMGVREYEEALARALRIGKLQQVVQDSVVVSEQEIYSEYEEDRQKRVFEYIAVPTERFKGASRGELTQEDLERVFDADPDQFRIPNRMQIEALKVNPGAFAEREPTEDEIRARYEQDKDSLYLAKEGFDLDDEGPEYLPLEGVRDKVITSAKKGMVQQLQQDLLAGALEEGKRRFGAGEEFALTDLVPEEHRERFGLIKSDLFSENQIKELPESIRHEPTFKSVFLKFDELQNGNFGEAIVPLNDGDYIFRYTALEQSRVPSLAECEHEVREKAAVEKSRELAVEFLAERRAEMTELESELSFEEIAQEENYTITATEAVSRFEGRKIDPSFGFEIARVGFAIPTVGETGDPVAPPTGDHAYLIRLVRIIPPDPGDFTDPIRESFRNRVLARKRQSAFDDYVTDLIDRASPRSLVPTVDS